MFNEEESPITARSELADSEPASNSTRIGRLEGKVDLLANDVREVLKQTVTQSKKLVFARTAGAAVAGALVAFAPANGEQIGKVIEALISLFA